MTETRTVTAGQTRFLLREQGSGPGTPVLLLHGVPETSRMWREVQAALAVGRRVLAPDLPGLGGSAYSGPYDVPSLVAQLVALIDAEVGGPDGPGRVDLVGHDWGGVLALGLAEARPDLIRRLCIANAPYRDIPFVRAAHVPFFALPAVPELLFRLGGQRVVHQMIKLAWRSATPLDPEARAEYAAAYGDAQRVSAMLGYYRAAARPKLAAKLPGRTAPAAPPRIKVEQSLVLWGAGDPVLPIGTGESVVRDLGPECAMITIPGAGHFVIEEAPEVVRTVLLKFLADEPAEVLAAVPETVPAAEPAEEPAEAPTVAKRAPRKAAPGRSPAGTTPAKQSQAKANPAKSRQPKTGPAK